MRTAGKSGGAKAFGLGSRVGQQQHAGEVKAADDHSDGESDRGDLQDPTEKGTVVGGTGGGAEGGEQGDETGDVQPAEPDDAVPMGLIASLSLNNSRKKGNSNIKNDEDESEDDDDVVSGIIALVWCLDRRIALWAFVWGAEVDGLGFCFSLL